MSFDLCNVSRTFQIFINVTLREYLNKFCTIYVDDILIYNNTRKKHVKQMRKILHKLKKAELYLNIDKCEFFVHEIKYLRLIIITSNIKMNSRKIEIIVNWKFSRCLKNVQTFLDFVNFYRRFIYEYFKLANFLTSFTKIQQLDFFFWNLHELEKKTFQILKKTFTIASILQHFDSDKEIWLETNVSDYVIAAVLSQYRKERLTALRDLYV